MPQLQTMHGGHREEQRPEPLVVLHPPLPRLHEAAVEAPREHAQHEHGGEARRAQLCGERLVERELRDAETGGGTAGQESNVPGGSRNRTYK